MAEETLLKFSLAAAEATANLNSTSRSNITNDNTNCIVSSSSNFSSFNLHINACSSPIYAQNINSKQKQISSNVRHYHNSRNCLTDKLNGRNLFYSEHFKTNKISNLGVLLDKRLVALLVLFVSIIVFYKMVIVTGES